MSFARAMLPVVDMRSVRARLSVVMTVLGFIGISI